FFGRKDDATLRQMLSHLPQAHTSYVANKVLERFYYSPLNRNPMRPAELIVEPVNQVHDEVCFIFPSDIPTFVADLFKTYKDVPLECWGSTFTIPFEAQFGRSWGEANENLFDYCK